MGILPVDTVQTVAEASGITLETNVLKPLAEDVEYRLRDVISEAIKFMRHSKRRKLLTDDINNALKVKNIEPLFGFSFGGPVRFKNVANQRLFYVEDQELDLEELINSALPEVPLEPTFTGHWLAIEGVQPAIIQNPTPTDKKHDVDGKSELESKLTAKQVLSKELQLYYDKIVEAVLSDDKNVQKLAIDSLENDPGIQPILPYLIQFVTEKITKNLRNLKVLWSCVFVLRSLLQNTNIYIEPYLHKIMPLVVTCLVGKKLGNTAEDHWELRNYAANLSSLICHKYNSTYAALQPRLLKTLLKAFLDPQKPFTTHYGAIVAFKALGSSVVNLFLAKNVATYGLLLRDEVLNSMEDSPQKEEATRCFEAIVEILKTDEAVVEEVNELKRNTSAGELGAVLEKRFGIFGRELV